LEGRIGVLKEGFDADFSVLENDILTIPQEKIKEVKAVRTVVKGKEVFIRK
jgi:predicted amidohydrolase YtcJ